MNKRYCKMSRRVVELILGIIALYLIAVAVLHKQEAKDALILMVLCLVTASCLEIQAYLKKYQRIVAKGILCVGGIIFCICELLILSGGESDQIEEITSADYILVLGNKLEDTGISATLQARLDCAVQIAENVEVPVIVSGGNTKVNALQEADAMKDYLLKNNVQNKIMLETQALDTKQNFLYTSELVGVDVELIIISSKEHMFRVKMLANYVGFQDIKVVGSKTDISMYLYYNLREVVALLRELVRMYM